jgi:hypothetical protein
MKKLFAIVGVWVMMGRTFNVEDHTPGNHLADLEWRL